MRLLVVIGLWLLIFLAMYGIDIWAENSAARNMEPGVIQFGVASGLYSLIVLGGIVYTIIRVGGREWGVRWYYVFALLVPYYNLYVAGRVFWFWAGRVVGTPRTQPSA